MSSPFGPASSSTRTASITTALGLVAVLLLILATGFFVAVEFALVAIELDPQSQVVASDRLVRAVVR